MAKHKQRGHFRRNGNGRNDGTTTTTNSASTSRGSNGGGSGRSSNGSGSSRSSALNVIIPMGGLKNNSVVPPPLRNIVGRPIVFWLLDHLTLGPEDTVWIGLPQEVDEYFALSKQVRGSLKQQQQQQQQRVLFSVHTTRGEGGGIGSCAKHREKKNKRDRERKKLSKLPMHLHETRTPPSLAPSLLASFKLSKNIKVANEFPQLRVHVVPLIFPTSGPIETIYIMLQAMGPEYLARKTISLDSATLYFSDVLGAFRQVRSSHGASFYFVQDDGNFNGYDHEDDGPLSPQSSMTAPEHSSSSSSSSRNKNKNEGGGNSGGNGGGGAFSYIQLSGGIITDIREKVKGW
jgi:hypothetical protein